MSTSNARTSLSHPSPQSRSYSITKKKSDAHCGMYSYFKFAPAVAVLIFYGSMVYAQDNDPSTSKSENSESREEALKRIEALNASVIVNGAVQPLKFNKDPILVFSDPTRKESSGTVWAIGTEGRPKAILSLFTISGENLWNYEFTSLTTESLSVGKTQKWAWKPKKSGLVIRGFDASATVASTPAARLSQMKSLTRDFAATEVYMNGTRIELRLLPRPLHRYADENQGIIDGAIFAFANGTNPEILLLVESVKGNSGQSSWQYGAARMSTAELHLQLKDAEVWTAENTKRDAADDPYYSRRESPPPPGFQ